MKKKKKAKKNKDLLAINLIIVGIIGVFIPILPAIILVLIGVFFTFPNILKQYKKRFF